MSAGPGEGVRGGGKTDGAEEGMGQDWSLQAGERGWDSMEGGPQAGRCGKNSSVLRMISLVGH